MYETPHLQPVESLPSNQAVVTEANENFSSKSAETALALAMEQIEVDKLVQNIFPTKHHEASAF